MMTFREFLSAVSKSANGPLTQQGFVQQKIGTYVRSEGERIDVIWIQKHSTDKACCVNLGIHYRFIPKIVPEELPIEGKITQPQCEIKIRLTDDPNQNNRWWPFGLAEVDSIVAVITRQAPTVFKLYALEGKITKISVEDIETDNSDLLEPMTRVRAALLLARIHDHLGNREQTVQFAQLGLKVAGMAVAPKRACREILKEHGALN